MREVAIELVVQEPSSDLADSGSTYIFTSCSSWLCLCPLHPCMSVLSVVEDIVYAAILQNAKTGHANFVRSPRQLQSPHGDQTKTNTNMQPIFMSLDHKNSRVQSEQLFPG